MYNRNRKTQKKENEEKFSLSDQYLATLFKYQFDAVIATDPNHHIKAWNNAAAEMFGYTVEEVTGKYVSDFIHISDETRSLWRAELIKYGQWKGEVDIVTKDGKLIRTLYSMSTIKNDAGELTDYIAAIKDISENIELREELKRLNENLQQQVNEKSGMITEIFSRISDGFVAFDQHLDITYVNPYFEKMISMSQSMLLGKNARQVFSDLFATGIMDIVMNSQQRFRTEAFAEKIGKWLSYSFYPSETGISVFIKDISMQKSKESEAELFRKIADNSIAYIGIANMKREVIYLNRAMSKAFSIPVSAQLSKYKNFDFYTEKGKLIIQEVLNSLNETDFWIGENEMISMDGKIIPVIQTIILIRDENGNPAFTSSSAIDITIQKEKQKEVARLADIIDNSLAFIGFSDPEGNIIYFNKAMGEVLDLNNRDLKKIDQLYTEKGLSIKEVVDAELTEKGYWTGESEFINPKGVTIPIYQTIRVHKSNTGELMYISVNAIDISAKKTAEKEQARLNAELRELSLHLQNIMEIERAETARELHDNFSQNMVALNLNASWLLSKLKDKGAEINTVLEEQINLTELMINSSRNLFNSLHPSMLDELGLESVIIWHANNSLKDSDIKFDLEYTLGHGDITKTINLGLFRIFQELLNNVIKHSQATILKIKICRIENSVDMLVEDNGIGFENTHHNLMQSHGLLVIRERIYAMNGTLNIQTKPGDGTVINIKIPIQ